MTLLLSSDKLTTPHHVVSDVFKVARSFVQRFITIIIIIIVFFQSTSFRQSTFPRNFELTVHHAWSI